MGRRISSLANPTSAGSDQSDHQFASGPDQAEGLQPISVLRYAETSLTWSTVVTIFPIQPSLPQRYIEQKHAASRDFRPGIM